MLLSAFLQRGMSALSLRYPEGEARSILSLLCGELLGTKSYTHILDPSFAVDPSREAELEEALVRLQEGEPVQYVLGKAAFFGRNFRVGPGVLIPRPETEQLCEMVLSACRETAEPAILDLCTGSGNIAWTLALEHPGACVTGVDKSSAALEIAESQLFSARFRPRFVRADILVEPDGFPAGGFDIIVSNPPYILDSEREAMRDNVLRYEPQEALFVPDEDPLLFYRAVARWAGAFLRPGGQLFAEINEDLGLSAKALMEALGFCNVLIHKDFYGKDRFVSCCKLQ
ncbi:MAG: peptide chain release factor N(5)-glutamine methyltransferase [Bacteroidales bacterium]|nr:peptide chain release factor N(5)-glutamine methyltransferase [Bacteroidales bacterium]